MRSTTHAVAGVAVATLFPAVVENAAAGNPSFVVLAVFCALLPDLMERVSRHGERNADISVVLDPLEPDAMLLAQGVATAAAKAVLTNKPCAVRLQPLPSACAVRGVRPEIRLSSATSEVVASLGQGHPKSRLRLPRLMPCWPNRFAVELPEGLLLRFWPEAESRKGLRCVVLERSWPHGLPFALIVILAAGLILGKLGAAVAGAALATHLLLDQGGLLGVDWRAPFGGRHPPLGWRLWRGDSSIANLSATWVAGLVLFWNLARHTAYLPWRPNLWGLLIFGYALPQSLLFLASRLRDKISGGQPRVP